MNYSVRPIITLTTDFGLKDYFVGSLKGVLLQKSPDARIIDITHQIARHDVISAAFIIKESFQYFPKGSVHLVVVDPGVGTCRRAILLSYRDHHFIGPDNGIFSYLLKDKHCRVYEILETSLHLREDSPTFAGRDHFAPIAAAVANRRSPADLGKEITDAKVIEDLFCRKVGERFSGRIVYIDTYGNAITNLTQSDLKAKTDDLELEVPGGRKLRRLKKSYSDGKKGEGNLILNSSGHLEIFVPKGSAQLLLNLNLLDEVIVH